jgi:hypothetical protein
MDMADRSPPLLGGGGFSMRCGGGFLRLFHCAFAQGEEAVFGA